MADAVIPAITIGGVDWYDTLEAHRGGRLHVTKDGTQVCLIKNGALKYNYKLQPTLSKGGGVYLNAGLSGKKYPVARMVMPSTVPSLPAW